MPSRGATASTKVDAAQLWESCKSQWLLGCGGKHYATCSEWTKEFVRAEQALAPAKVRAAFYEAAWSDMWGNRTGAVDGSSSGSGSGSGSGSASGTDFACGTRKDWDDVFPPAKAPPPGLSNVTMDAVTLTWRGVPSQLWYGLPTIYQLQYRLCAFHSSATVGGGHWIDSDSTVLAQYVTGKAG